MQSHSQHTSSSATRRRDHSAAACPATWLVGLTLLFAATASDRVGARRLAGRFLPEYDFEAANERCFYHQRDANESGEGWWFGGAATSSSASDSHHGQPLVSESEGCRPNSAEDTSAEGGSSWLPGTESENTDTLGRGTSRSSQRTETRRRSRSRRRRSLSAGRRAQGDVSSDADVDPSSSSSTPSSRASRSTIEAAGDLPSVPPLAARFGTTVAAAAVMTAVGANVAVRNVSVRSSPSTPTPSARFVPLPATFASDCQPESAHRGAIPWCCGVCRSPVFQYGTKSCCVDCHAPFDRAAVRVFTGQLRKENTAAYIRWLFALVAPQVQLLHVEAHTTKGEQRTRGAAFVHVPTFEDGAELCQALNRRVFADVQVDGRSGHRVEGVWLVPEEEADRLAEYAASRANAIDRPNVLPRQPVVLEQRGKPSETAQPFRPWVATVPAATFTPMSANVLPPARSTPELVGSFAQQPPQVAVTYTHNPYAWNPFALLPMQHAGVGARVSAAYQPSGWY